MWKLLGSLIEAANANQPALWPQPDTQDPLVKDSRFVREYANVIYQVSVAIGSTLLLV